MHPGRLQADRGGAPHPIAACASPQLHIVSVTLADEDSTLRSQTIPAWFLHSLTVQALTLHTNLGDLKLELFCEEVSQATAVMCACLMGWRYDACPLKCRCPAPVRTS